VSNRHLDSFLTSRSTSLLTDQMVPGKIAKDQRINHWRSLKYHDPASLLVKLRELEIELAAADLDPKLLRLRLPELKKYREWRDAAVLCYGLGLAQGHQIGYATEEREDYDFVASWIDGTTQHFTPVQLKELVPADLNPEATLDDLLQKASRTLLTDTVLAIKLNRRGQIDLAEVRIPRLKWKQLWFFWSSSPNGQKWSIYGDALLDPGYFTFDYPTA
jgi:hypothetical protein